MIQIPGAFRSFDPYLNFCAVANNEGRHTDLWRSSNKQTVKTKCLYNISSRKTHTATISFKWWFGLVSFPRRRLNGRWKLHSNYKRDTGYFVLVSSDRAGWVNRQDIWWSNQAPKGQRKLEQATVKSFSRVECLRSETVIYALFYTGPICYAYMSSLKIRYYYMHTFWIYPRLCEV